MHKFHCTSFCLNLLSAEDSISEWCPSWGWQENISLEIFFNQFEFEAEIQLFQSVAQRVGMVVRRRSWKATLESRWEMSMGWSGICLFIKLIISIFSTANTNVKRCMIICFKYLLSNNSSCQINTFYLPQRKTEIQDSRHGEQLNGVSSTDWSNSWR